MAKIDLARRSTVRGDSAISPNLDKVAPPSTPPQKSRKSQGKGSLNAPRTRLSNNIRDTFIADQARGTAGGNEHHRKQSSHDLSWSPRQTRDSVMDNMLQSLDQMYASDPLPRTAPHRSAEPQDPFDLGPHSSNRLRGHTFSSSLSSDRSLRIQESSPKSSRGTRGHRSNSSSNYSSGLTRIDSIRPDRKKRAETEDPPSIRERLYESQRALKPEERAAASTMVSNSRSRKTSKSSKPSSQHFGQMIHDTRIRRSIQRRSSSFDLAEHRRRDAQVSGGGPVRSPVPISRLQVLKYNDLEAAPTPVVPSGPSRNNSPVRSNGPAHAAVTEPRILTPRDKGSKSASTPRQRHAEKPEERHGKAKNSSKLPSHSKGPSMDATIPVTPATAEKPRHVSEPKASTSAGVQARERPGFFRRVFGSTRGTITTVTETSSLADGLPLSVGNMRGGSRGSTVPQPASYSKMIKSATDSSLSTAGRKEGNAMPAAPLNKKSSFFRRRKKSLSEEPLMPMLLPPLEPPNFQDPLSLRDPHPSPVSSLRKVMDPYLSHTISAQSMRKGDVREKETSRIIPPFPQPNFVFAPRVDSLMKAVTVPNLPADESNSENVEAQGDVARSAPRKEINLNATVNASPEHMPIEQSYTYTENQKNDNVKNDNPNLENVTHERTVNDHALNSHAIAKKVSLDTQNRPFQSRSATTDTITTTAVGGISLSSELPLQNQNSADTMESVMKEKGVFLTDWDSPVSTRSPHTNNNSLSKNASGRSARIYLQSTASEDHLLISNPNGASLKFTNDSTMGSCCSIPRGDDDANSNVASPVTDESIELSATLTGPNEDPVMLTESEVAIPDEISDEPTNDLPNQPSEEVSAEPSDEDRIVARKIFAGDESIVSKTDAASWLARPGIVRAKVLNAYMELFNWQNMGIVTAVRDLCSQLFVKAESQELLRLFEAYSTRWCECNPNHGFKSPDIVFFICYSVIMLNGDLHQPKAGSKMTKSEFVRNTMPSILAALKNAGPDAFSPNQSSTMSSTRPEHPLPQLRSNSLPVETQQNSSSSEATRPVHRLSILPSDYSGVNLTSTTTAEYGSINDCGPLVKAPYHGRHNGWVVQVETVLKKAYDSIRQQPIPLEDIDESSHQEESAIANENTGTLTKAGNILRRTPSMLSKAGSENQGLRSRSGENSSRFGTTRWNTKNRPRPRLNAATSGNGPSGRSSIDDISSAMPSPAANSTWTKFSANRTQTSMESLAITQPEHKKSIGFASALSQQAAIREESTVADNNLHGGNNSNNPYSNNNNNNESIRPAPMLDDESLLVEGAPWAKEGNLKHKHFYEAEGKKARNRDWFERFAVVTEGYLKLFSFSSSRSLRQRVQRRQERAPAPGTVVGGGNWMDNAELIVEFELMHTIAQAVPGGYSTSKPYVWGLTLTTGAVHIFEVGTPEIVNEFVATSNYWAARLSKLPIAGAVSSIEYGWSAAVIGAIFHAPAPSSPAGPAAASSDDAARVSSIDFALPASARAMSSTSSTENRPLSKDTPAGNQLGRPSMQGSVRSGTDHVGGFGASKGRLPGDRVVINEWNPPQTSIMASTLLEIDQLRAIRTYMESIQREWDSHNWLKEGISQAYSHRHTNHAKALKNWHAKEEYLTKELVKFKKYEDVLVVAGDLADEKRRERAAREAAVEAAVEAVAKEEIEE